MVQCVRDIKAHGDNDLTRRFVCQHPPRQSLSQSLGCGLGWDIRCGFPNTLYLGAPRADTQTRVRHLRIQSVLSSCHVCGQPGLAGPDCLSAPVPQREHLGFAVGLRFLVPFQLAMGHGD